MRYNALMQSAESILEQFYLEMRWRILSVAADFDRIERASGGSTLLRTDSRVAHLRAALQVVGSSEENRAERVQQLLSDQTPPPL